MMCVYSLQWISGCVSRPQQQEEYKQQIKGLIFTRCCLSCVLWRVIWASEWIRIAWTNKMHCFILIYFSSKRVYEGVSKSPRTMLITRKSLVVHEFPARVCRGGILWVSAPSGEVGCGSFWLLHVSLCVYYISRLRFSDIGGMAEVDERRVCIKFCVRLSKMGSETFEMLKQAFGDSCMSRSWTFEWFGRFKNGFNC